MFVLWRSGFLRPNNPPKIVSFTPNGSGVELTEGESLTFQVLANDPDGDPIKYSWLMSNNLVLSESKRSDSESNWRCQTAYGGRGKHVVKCSVSDDRGASAEKSWELSVHYIELEAAIDDFSYEWIRDSTTDNPCCKIGLKGSIYNHGDTVARNVIYDFGWDGKIHSSTIDEIQAGRHFSWSLPEETSGQYGSTHIAKLSAKCMLSHNERVVQVNVPNLPRYMPLDTARLYVTPNDSSVKRKVNSILANKFILTPDWIAIRDWCGSQIKYMYDSEAHGEEDYWQLPCETLQLQHGDCEDSAILLCSMLRRAGYAATDVYVVVGEADGVGHAWVSFKWFNLLGQESWIRLEPTAGGGIIQDFFSDFISTFQDRKIFCTFNDVYYTKY